jgi:hypothetical protein
MSTVTHPVGSILADDNDINKMMTGGPVGGLNLRDKATTRQLFKQTGVLVFRIGITKSQNPMLSN